MEQDHDQLVANFRQLTNLPEARARQFLEENDWLIDEAVSQYYDELNGDARDEEEDELTAATPNPPPPTGRRLGNEGSAASSVPGPTPSGSTASGRGPPSQPKKKFKSLKDLQNEAESHDHDDDSDKDQEYFAGGDKSGLAVTEPGSGHNQHVQRLLDQARRAGVPPPIEESQQSHFSGQGQTLGGDDAPSQIIPDPNAGTRRPAQMVERTLHLWDDGFSIDDGPLHRYDDPANARTLEMINRGSAPLDLMNVEPGQAVDVRLAQHRGEKYVEPKRKFTTFSGGGQRLGSPVPGAAIISTAPTPSAPPAAPSSAAPTTQVDDAQPSLTLQVRLADGTRMPSRFNTTQTIGDVYAFVDRASPGSTQRAYTLATTFPTKDLTDKTQVLGDMAEFKRGGVVVQKWT